MPRLVATALFALLLTACGGGTRADLKLLDTTLDQFASAVRWGTPDQLVAFIDPEVLRTRPIREFDVERLRQLRVGGFRAQPPVLVGEDRARQVAEVELINVNTQQGRSAVEVTEWRWDATAQRWWLVSGLPRYDSGR
jgi:hypothetical protein